MQTALPVKRLHLTQAQRVVIVVALGALLFVIGTWLTALGTGRVFGWVAYSPPPNSSRALAGLGMASWARVLIRAGLIVLWLVTALVLLRRRAGAGDSRPDRSLWLGKADRVAEHGEVGPVDRRNGLTCSREAWAMRRRDLNQAQRVVIVVGLGALLLVFGSWFTSGGWQRTFTGWTGYAPLTVASFYGGMATWAQLLVWIGLIVIWLVTALVLLRKRKEATD